MASSGQFCTFYLNQLLFGIETQKIQEVVTYRELRPVPLAHPAVGGLMNLRGQVIVALELRRQLEFPERPSEIKPVCLVVRAAGGTVCLLADEVGNVVEVKEETFEPSPETLSPRLRSVIRGVHKLEHELMHVLDADQACDFTANRSQAHDAGLSSSPATASKRRPLSHGAPRRFAGVPSA